MNSSPKNIVSRFGFILWLFTALLLTTAYTKAQTKKGSNALFITVEEQAQFPGGFPKFTEYLSHNLHYPAQAKAANIQGRVFLTFVVEKDGRLTNIKVLRGIGHGCDEEAMRVVKASPKWKPGRQNNKAVRTQYTLPISFTLTKNNI
ncbi:energy transducer TonB [Mucilaginibacter boryungensis]|uniref:Energy transducer TonB n=1 Tax=Mucilaginibacter boryungensis TaxID=768480 RepID=A0ABR9XLC7_9SPHI|nr:energy transducer TonB [Mucilaginibacter boryungensis]MBE9668187.1 energy transducer TonB [Mucilaginibacter boryungensis]